MDIVVAQKKSIGFRKDWPLRENMKVGKANVVHKLKKILLPLHIKLGLMQQFINVLDKRAANFYVPQIRHV